jgi:hypothetical protein
MSDAADSYDEENFPFFNIDGKEVCNKEVCVAQLLKDGILFVSGRELKWTEHYKDGDMECSTICLMVNCNDLFAWGTADCEGLPYREIGPLWKAWKSGPWGVTRWCCVRRNEQPQGPVKRRMIAEGHWDETLESLPENYETRFYREEKERKSNES